jgi:hypothetical protein
MPPALLLGTTPFLRDWRSDTISGTCPRSYSMTRILLEPGRLYKNIFNIIVTV